MRGDLAVGQPQRHLAEHQGAAGLEDARLDGHLGDVLPDRAQEAGLQLDGGLRAKAAQLVADREHQRGVGGGHERLPAHDPARVHVTRAHGQRERDGVAVGGAHLEFEFAHPGREDPGVECLQFGDRHWTCPLRRPRRVPGSQFYVMTT